MAAIMSQLRRVTENSGVHKQRRLILNGITAQQLTAQRKATIGLLNQFREKKNHSAP